MSAPILALPAVGLSARLLGHFSKLGMLNRARFHQELPMKLEGWDRCHEGGRELGAMLRTRSFFASQAANQTLQGRDSCRRSVCIYRALARAVNRMPEPGTIKPWWERAVQNAFLRLLQSVEAEGIFHRNEVLRRILVQPKAGFVAIRHQHPNR